MRRNVTTKEVEQNVQYLLDNMSGEGGGTSKLSELEDVTITNATDGQILSYNGTKWINANITGGDSVKEITYVGVGGDNTISLENKPRVILAIGGEANDGKHVVSRGAFMVNTYRTRVYGDWYRDDGSHGGDILCMCYWDNSNNNLILTDNSSNDAKYNEVGKNYTMYYI